MNAANMCEAGLFADVHATTDERRVPHYRIRCTIAVPVIGTFVVISSF